MIAYMYENSCLSLPLTTGVVSPGGASGPRSSTEIPYWWFKICPESCKELWLVDLVVIVILITNGSQKTNGHKGQSTTKQSVFMEYSYSFF